MTLKEQVLWVAHTLFQKGLVSGSTGNISYRVDNTIYVSQSGSCFGLLDDDGFAEVSINGLILKGKPSKEWPMHLKLYQENDDIKAVIHTHSFNSTLVSCLKDLNKEMIDQLFEYTPYLEMQTNGKIGIVDYGKPGSEDLFNKFNKEVNKETLCYLLRNHGVFVGSENALKAFYILEEFEQTCGLFMEINGDCKKEFSKIK